MKAGIAIARSDQLTLPNCEAIKIPTNINAGAVTAPVINVNNGQKNKETIKKIETKTAVRPERPPTSIPDKDSTYEVVDEVPTTAPTTVAAASAANALLDSTNLPSSSNK